MTVKIILFGPLTDITGTASLSLHNVSNTDQLVEQMHRLYPAMEASRYIIAVEQELVTGNVVLLDGYTVALLPPYAGG